MGLDPMNREIVTSAETRSLTPEPPQPARRPGARGQGQASECVLQI